MFKIRPIPSSTVVDITKVYNSNNVVEEGRFWLKEAWALFEMRGQQKYAISLLDLIKYEYADYEEASKTAKLPPIPKALYERMRSYAELNEIMRGL